MSGFVCLFVCLFVFLQGCQGGGVSTCNKTATLKTLCSYKWHNKAVSCEICVLYSSNTHHEDVDLELLDVSLEAAKCNNY